MFSEDVLDVWEGEESEDFEVLGCVGVMRAEKVLSLERT